MKKVCELWVRVSLIKKIGIGVVIGVILGLLVPDFTGLSILGKLFVGGLKAIAPLLVFALVSQTISHQKKERDQYDPNHCSLFIWDFCSSFGSCFDDLFIPADLDFKYASQY